jgi:signal transduction histidine kinase
MSKRILVVDDDPDIRAVLEDRLSAYGYRVACAGDGRAALSVLDQGGCDLVLLDVELPGAKGLSVLGDIHRAWSHLPVIIMTAYASIPLAVQAMKEGATDFVTKPLEFHQLELSIPKALERKELGNEVAKLLGEISHELKNLLQPMVCGTDLLESEITDLVQRLRPVEVIKAEESHSLCREVIDMLRNTTQRMQERMKGIADYVNLLKKPVIFAPCHLDELVEKVIAPLTHIARPKGVDLRQEGLKDLPPIMADEGRLFILLYNLVHNALAEVPPNGWVSVCGKVATTAETVVLTIGDNGPGMPAPVRDSLFTAQRISQKPGGTGLGLKIVKEIVDDHGGEITVDSTEGKGTSFYVRLPIRR